MTGSVLRLLVVAALVAACGGPQPPAPDQPRVENTGGSLGPPAAALPVITDASPSYLLVKGANYEGVISRYSAWVPTAEDIAALEAVLGPAITAGQLGKAYPAARFKRGYRGTLVGTARVIDVSLACEVDAGYPADGVPMVADGGTCYGSARWSTVNGRLDVYANGNG